MLFCVCPGDFLAASSAPYYSECILMFASMKSILRVVVTFLLSRLAKLKLRRDPGRIIGITGSVGKTTTKDAVAHLLKDEYKVRYTEGGLNTEIGVPMLILGLTQESGSLFSWFGLLLKGLASALTKEGIEYYVVEMGVDSMGDMKKLIKIAPPHIAILTEVAMVHAAEGQFNSEQSILREKSQIFSKQKDDDVAIINIDNEHIRGIKNALPGTVVTYGKRDEALVTYSHVKQKKDSLQFQVEYKGHMSSFQVPVLGSHLVGCLLPAIIVGVEAGLSMNEMAEKLTTFTLPKGRMNLLEGVRGSAIIDSSYNSSPVALVAALRVLNEFPGERKIACLGQMNELGDISKEEHIKIGQLVPAVADWLITVGPHGKYIAETAKEHGMRKDRVHHFKSSSEAGAWLEPKLRRGDVILAKGSQNLVYIEELVKQILKEPKMAPKLLVRQNGFWRKKKSL